MEKESSGTARGLRSTLPWILLVLVTTVGLFGILYYRDQARNISKVADSSTTEQQNQVETERVLTALKKVLLVQETEAPTVARVEDPERQKKSNEEFYKNVEKGDYLIIFPKRAIIYRESIDQIINTAPIINTADLQKQSEEATTPATN